MALQKDCCCCWLSHLSFVRLCATLWTAAYQAPLSVGFSRQEYRRGWPFPSPQKDCINLYSYSV